MNSYIRKRTTPSLKELFLLAATVGAFIHYLYFMLAPIIWAQYETIPLSEFTPWTRFYATERDGVEIYALYISVFAEIILLLSLTYAWTLISSITWRKIFNGILVLISGCYFVSIGLHLPMSNFYAKNWIEISLQTLPILLGLMPLVLIFYVIRNNEKLAFLAAVIILIPVCFIATGPASLSDYGYVLAPALRIIKGVSISEIYLQYDLLLSLLAACILYFHLDPNLLQTLGQASFYILFLGIFLFSKRLFFNKNLSIFLLLALVLIRIYAGSFYANASFQVTPFRLDLWLLILVAIYFKGPHHWLTGAVLGILIVLHRNFGIIYFAAYCQLLITILCFDYGDKISKGIDKWLLIRRLLVSHICINRSNLLIAVVAFCCGVVLLGSNSAYRYQKIGIGFIRISNVSFYWYLAILIPITLTLLFKLRDRLPEKYFLTSCLLVYLAVGNSVYFFGRSHENNIINISAIFLLLLFLFLDLIQTTRSITIPSKQKSHQRMTLALAAGAAFFIVVSYSDTISGKISLQRDGLKMYQYIYPNQYSRSEMENNIESIQSVTGDSKKLYFVSDCDFYYYYYGHYDQVGYYNPFSSWVFSNDMAFFINGLLDKGYYIVVDKPDLIRELMPRLRYSTLKGNNKYIIFWK